jgi:hypoxanthine phosphoribosyltransferase
MTTATPAFIPNAQQLTPYISADAIQERIKAMAGEINQKYADCDKLIVIAILRGSFMFASDLVKHLNMPCQIEFVRLASYGNSTTSSGNVKPVDLTLPDLNDKDVLIVEDIVDTGLTMHFFRNYLQSLHRIKSLSLAVLLDKAEARSKEIPPFPVDYAGFTVGNEFLIGYGLDYAGLYRNLPFVAVMPEAYLPQ